MDNRIGKIIISHESIRTNIDELYEVFSTLKFIPVKVESLYMNNEIEMFGYSPMFKDVKEGQAAPEYNIIITKHEDDNTMSYEIKAV